MSDTKLPEDRRYTKSHEWVKIEGTEVTVGITDHAQSELTDIVFVDLPAAGKAVTAGSSALVLESVKTVADVYGRQLRAQDPPGADQPGPVREGLDLQDARDRSRGSHPLPRCGRLPRHVGVGRTLASRAGAGAALAPLELRRATFEERAHPFRLVLGPEQVGR
jgi:hypothetical protein